MAANDREEDALAYGEYHGRAPADEDENYQGGGDRGIIGDTYRRWRNRHQPQPVQNQNHGAVSRVPRALVLTYQPGQLLIDCISAVALRSIRERSPDLPAQPLQQQQSYVLIPPTQ